MIVQRLKRNLCFDCTDTQSFICKTEVQEAKGAAAEYPGKKYYFCAVGCKKAFDQNPEKYLARGND